MRLAHNILSKKLIFACSNSSDCPRDVSMFVTHLRWTHCRDILLCSSQNAMSEFAAFFSSFHSHQSRWSVSMLGASIQTCASVVNLNIIIMYLSCFSLSSVLFWCLQHALPHFINVCNRLDLQYDLSGQHCLHLLTIFPMNSCSHPSFVCCRNNILNCWGIISAFNNSDIVISIINPLGFPFKSSLLCISVTQCQFDTRLK